MTRVTTIHNGVKGKGFLIQDYILIHQQTRVIERALFFGHLDIDSYLPNYLA